MGPKRRRHRRCHWKKDVKGHCTAEAATTTPSRSSSGIVLAVGRSVAVRPSAGRLAGLTGAGGRSVVSLYRKAVVVVVVVVAAAAAARGSFLFSFVRVSDNGQIVCSASVAVVCGRRSSSGQVSLSD